MRRHSSPVPRPARSSLSRQLRQSGDDDDDDDDGGGVGQQVSPSPVRLLTSHMDTTAVRRSGGTQDFRDSTPTGMGELLGQQPRSGDRARIREEPSDVQGRSGRGGETRHGVVHPTTRRSLYDTPMRSPSAHRDADTLEPRHRSAAVAAADVAALVSRELARRAEHGPSHQDEGTEEHETRLLRAKAEQAQRAIDAIEAKTTALEEERVRLETQIAHVQQQQKARHVQQRMEAARWNEEEVHLRRRVKELEEMVGGLSRRAQQHAKVFTVQHAERMRREAGLQQELVELERQVERAERQRDQLRERCDQLQRSTAEAARARDADIDRLLAKWHGEASGAATHAVHMVCEAEQEAQRRVQDELRDVLVDVEERLAVRQRHRDGLRASLARIEQDIAAAEARRVPRDPDDPLVTSPPSPTRSAEASEWPVAGGASAGGCGDLLQELRQEEVRLTHRVQALRDALATKNAERLARERDREAEEASPPRAACAPPAGRLGLEAQLADARGVAEAQTLQAVEWLQSLDEAVRSARSEAAAAVEARQHTAQALEARLGHMKEAVQIAQHALRVVDAKRTAARKRLERLQSEAASLQSQLHVARNAVAVAAAVRLAADNGSDDGGVETTPAPSA